MTNLGDEYTPEEAHFNRIFDRLTWQIGAAIMSSAENAAQDVLATLNRAKAEIAGLLDTQNAAIEQLKDAAVEPATIASLQEVADGLDAFVADEPPA